MVHIDYYIVLTAIQSLSLLIHFRRLFSLALAVLLLPQFAGAAPSVSLPLSETAREAQTELHRYGSAAEVRFDAGNGSAPVTENQPDGQIDPLSGDQPFEMDKISAPVIVQWRMTVVQWDDGYRARVAPEPIFSFERPPRRNFT